MKHKCETIFYIGMGEERRCNRKVTHIFDEGRDSQMYICAACARSCHPRRVKALPTNVTNPGRSTFDA